MNDTPTIVEIVDALMITRHVDKIRKFRPNIQYGEAYEYCLKNSLNFDMFVTYFWKCEQETN